MQFSTSSFNRNLSEQSGVIQLMIDLGDALNDPNTISLGGGNPAHIPEVETEIASWLRDMASDPERIKNSFGKYSSPIGDRAFREAYAELLNRSFGWNISSDNIALTNGSQSAFFALFNSLATKQKPVFCPFSPDYIGYRDMGIDGDLISAEVSKINLNGSNEFTYELNMPDMSIDYGAVCVSTPCNPTGRCLKAEEFKSLHAYCTRKKVPLIIDSAYGAPAPNIVYNQQKLPWLDYTFYCFSLSKIGLPGGRTGIVVGPTDWIDNLARLTARMNLAPSNIAANLITPAIQSNRLTELCDEVITPYYRNVLGEVIALFQAEVGDIPMRWHRVDGGFFMWLWFDALPISDHQLYEKLKANNVVVVPGSYFFSSKLRDWPHSQQCLRISLGQPLERIEAGVQRLLKTVREVYEFAR